MSLQSSRDVETSVSHPYRIRFLIDLTDRQERQYENITVQSESLLLTVFICSISS